MGRCKDCRKWVGNSFQNNGRESRPCFFKVLIGNFSKKLWIPQRFAEYLRAGGAILRGPSGNIWNVRLKRQDGRFFFGKGWQKFATHHQLNTADFLIFRYDGALEFNVLIFDRSGCQRADAFFARSLENADENEEQNKRQNAGESFVEVIAQPRAASNGISKEAHVDCISVKTGETNSQQKQGKLSECSSKVVPKPDRVGEEAFSVIQSVHSDTKLNLLRSDIYIHLNHQPKRSGCRKRCAYSSQRCNENEKGAKIGSRYACGAEACSQYQTGTLSLSERRSAMIEEKSRSLMLARSFHSRHPFFISAMHRSCVSDPFKLQIPMQFARAHLVMKTTKVILRNAMTGEWSVTCLHARNKGLRLSGGWPAFVHAHSLVEGDACVFELLEEEGLLMNVIIYRMEHETMLRYAGDC